MTQSNTEQIILSVENLRKYYVERKGLFSRKKSIVKAVDDVSLSVRDGEVLGLVGESGCGKTTLGRTISRLYQPTAGQVIYRRKTEGNTYEESFVTEMNRKELRELRQDIQVVFQDPSSSLNARWDVKSIVAEPLLLQGLNKTIDIEDHVADTLKTVGLSPDHMRRYPHEFSGGQRQRIGIARALALRPKVVIADEPVSALDVSVQAQILNLLLDLRSEFGLTYIFIAHDLLVVEYVSDRIAVMYLGKIVELGDSDSVFRQPRHPYTAALLSAVPFPNPRHKTKRTILQGDVPSPANIPEGCSFHPRCRFFKDGLCNKAIPTLREMESGHFVACARTEEIELRGLEQFAKPHLGGE